ncbi:MAG: hypothetical protein R6V47_07510 [Candidatus Delongbacteria bacterium]
MIRFAALVLPLLIVCLAADECEVFKAEIDSLMTEFNAVKEKMSEPGISRDEYEDLYSIYTATWEDVVSAQRAYKECLEDQKKTVTVKVDPKRVDSDLPQIMDIKWRSDRTDVKETLRNYEDIRIHDADKTLLQYKGGKYLSENVDKWQFDFLDQELYACVIVFEKVKGVSPLRLYNDLSDRLKKKYGDPSYEKDKFPSGYNDDEIRLNAIKNGTVKIYRRWLFNNDDSVKIGFHTDGSVLITFIIDSLYKKLN